MGAVASNSLNIGAVSALQPAGHQGHNCKAVFAAIAARGECARITVVWFSTLSLPLSGAHLGCKGSRGSALPMADEDSWCHLWWCLLLRILKVCQSSKNIRIHSVYVEEAPHLPQHLHTFLHTSTPSSTPSHLLYQQP